MSLTDEAPRAVLIATGLADLEARNPGIEGRVTPDSTFGHPPIRLRHLAFAAGSALREHHAPFDIMVTVLDGRVRFGLGEEWHDLSVGGMIFVPAMVAHEVIADEPARITIQFLN